MLQIKKLIKTRLIEKEIGTKSITGELYLGVGWSEHHGYISHERFRSGKAIGEGEVPCVTW